tara:strand:+ start:6946 stop:8679 length:1734 start_codon:yes stop_codon:yes gene_type:complete
MTTKKQSLFFHKLKNKQLSKIFYEMALLLKMQDIPFKPEAYANASREINNLPESIQEIAKRKELENIPYIGKNIAEKIIEFLKTKKIKKHKQLKRKIPINICELILVQGIGVKTIKTLYKKLKIKNLKDLESAANLGKISVLPGFSQKIENNILQSIKFVKKNKNKFLLGEVLPIAEQIKKQLKNLPEVKRIQTAGSVCRMQETIGDINLLAVSGKPDLLMQYFCSMPGIKKIIAKGKTKSLIRLESGLNVDLCIVKSKSWGSGLQYFTGSKEHNINLRKIAEEKGLLLNEYGLFKNKKCIAGKTEKEIYNALDMDCPAPELRTASGEIQASQNHTLPKIIKQNSIKADLHMHTDWSDGLASIQEMAQTAQSMGYEYIAITDHVGKLDIANALDKNKLMRQIKEIDKVNAGFTGFRILKGCEENIRKDGSLDLPDSVLAKLDIVIASVHNNMKMNKIAMTKRIIKAMENPHVNIIGHATGRILKTRQGYDLDWPLIFKASKKTNTALEINAFYDRLDIGDKLIRMAINAGVKLVISTDSHSPEHLKYMKLGIAQARRGWAEKKNILNTMSFEKFLNF